MLEKVKLGNLIKVHSGDGIAVNSLLEYGDYPVYGGNGINGYSKRYNVYKDTMIIGRVGEKCGNVNITFKNSWISDNALIVLPIKKYNNIYLKYLLNYINLNNYANKNAQPVISGKIINDIDINYLTETKEQTQIASVLSNMDNLLDSLKNAIEKKENLKIAYIQKYFTGKERLKKYNSKWIYTTIKGLSLEILKGNGLSKEKLDTKGKNKCILYGELFTLYKELIKDIMSHTNEWSEICSKKGDILIPCSTTTVGKDLAKACVINENNILLGSDINIIRVKKGISPLFIAYLFSNILYKEVEKVTQGTTIIHLHGKNIAKIPTYIPSEYEEQEELACIIQNVDNELDLLKQKLEKYKKIKEGMMEDLLTGKVRLNYE